MEKRISSAVIHRMPRYFRHLCDLQDAGIARISSGTLADRMGLTASQVRQDFNCFGGFGQQGYGYNVAELRSAIAGIMHIDWVRRDVRKVFIKYNAISESELAYVMGLMQGKEFTFKFLDQGTVQTINAYVGESNYEFYSYSDVYDEGVYVNFEMHVIEM